jgi:hypothetical protein
MHRVPMRCLRPIAFALLAGCAHGESFEDGVLRKGDISVQIGPVPGHWRRILVDGADLAYRDDARAGSALFDVRCGQRDDDAPLSVLTQNLLMGTTERDFESQILIPLDGREAMHTVVRAKLDGVPMQYDIFVMKKDGCVHDLIYVAPPERFAEGAADFERFASGLHAHSGASDVSSTRVGDTGKTGAPVGSSSREP